MPEQPTQQRTILVISAIVLVVVIAHYAGLLQPIERIVLRILSPIGRVSGSFVRSTLTGSGANSAVNRSASELEQRVTELTVQNVELRTELNALRQSITQQDFSSSRRFSTIQARIFARSPDSSSVYVVIDKGSRSSIVPGQPAIIGNGIVVGKVISTTDDTAKILLSIDNRSSFSGVSAVNSVAQGVVTGVQGLSLIENLIPQSETVQPRETIITSGIDAYIPKGLVLGEIDRIEKHQGDLFQSAILHTPYVTSELDVLTVVLGLTP